MMFDGVAYKTAYQAESSNGTNGKKSLPSARELILGLPERFRQERASKVSDQTFHFDFSGEGGGAFTVQVSPRGVSVEEGHLGQAVCTVKATSADYAALETGQMDPQAALMSGKVAVSDLAAMMAFTPLFRRWS
jgi:putative sterol carrier protein